MRVKDIMSRPAHTCQPDTDLGTVAAMAEQRGIPYGFEQRLPGTTFDGAIEWVTAALQTEGFGVLTKIDVKDTLKKKLDVDIRPYVILGACNPSLAHQALGAEPQIGLLLPCNVVVREDDAGGVVASVADPKAMFALVDNPRLKPVVEEAERRLRRVVAALAVLDVAFDAGQTSLLGDAGRSPKATR